MPDSSATVWRRTRAWDFCPRIGNGGAPGAPGVTIDLVADACLATLIIGKGKEAALKPLVDEIFGCALPAPGQVAFGQACDLVWSAPGQWLVIWHSAAVAIAEIEGVATLTDQSDSRAVLHVSGPKAREALARGFAIDLHPTAFSTGSTAVTNVAHMSVQIWQCDESPRFTIALPRSFVGSFWSWLESAAAAFGYEVSDAA